MTHQAVSAAVDLALVTMLVSDGDYVTFLGGAHVFSAEVPADVKPAVLRDYLVIGTSSENAAGPFMARGGAYVGQLHMWSRLDTGNMKRTGRGQILTHYAHLARLLHQQQLSVAGFQALGATIRLVTVLRDPAGLMHGVAEYSATLLPTA